MTKWYGGIEAGGTKFLCTVVADPENILVAKSLRIRTLLSEEFIERMGFVFKEKPEKEQKEKKATPVEKPDTSKMSDKEVQEWLDLFGPVPERPKTSPRQPQKPSPQSTSAQKKPATLRVAKTDKESKLDQDEIDLWLSLFGSDENDS